MRVFLPYFKAMANDDGLSGDDINRRRREKRFGFKLQGDDWADCRLPIVCVFPGQYYTDRRAPLYHYNFKMIVI